MEVRHGLFCVQGQLVGKPPANPNIHEENDMIEDEDYEDEDLGEDEDEDEDDVSPSHVTSNELIRQCHVDFMVVDDQPYALDIFFTKSNQDVMTKLKLTKICTAPSSPPKKAKKGKKGKKGPNKKMEEKELTDDGTEDKCLLYAWASVDSKENVKIDRKSSDEWISSLFFYQKAQQPINQRHGHSYSDFKLKLSLWMDFGMPELKAQRRQLHQLAGLFVRQTHCDVKFHLSKNKETIGAHVAILSAASPVFAAMFEHNLQEARTRTVNIGDTDPSLEVEPEVFKRMLSYMYDGKAGCLEDEMFVQKLLVLADRYRIITLKDECELHLQSIVDIENVLVLLVFAEKYRCAILREKALEFAADHKKLICFQHEWEELMKNHNSICLELSRRMASR